MIRAIRDGMRARGAEAMIFATDLGSDNFADRRCFGTRSGGRILLQTANPSAYFSLARLLREFDPEIVHVRMFLTQLSPLILPLLRGRRAIFHLAWYRAICPKGTKLLPDGRLCDFPWGKACLDEGCVPLRDWLPLMAQKSMLTRHFDAFDRIVANSRWVQARFARAGIPSQVIHNGVAVPLDAAGPAEDQTVVFAGRLTKEKGCAVLIEAFARAAADLPGARLLIAGDGPQRSALEEQASALGLQESVRFLGKVPHDDLPTFWRSARLCAIPSLWEEPFGIVATEAMMRGLPVVASELGGLSEIVENGATGYLVRPGDVAALTAALRHLLVDAEAARRFGARGRSRAIELFSIERCVGSFAALYEELLDEGPGPHA